jgi:hypothetical protein
MTKVVKVAENWFRTTSDTDVVISDCHASYGSAMKMAMKVDDISRELWYELYNERMSKKTTEEQLRELDWAIGELEARVAAAGLRLMN